MLLFFLGIILGFILCFLFTFYNYDGLLIISDDSKWVFDIHKSIENKKFTIFRIVKDDI